MKGFKKDSEKTRLFSKSAKNLQEYDPIGDFFKRTCLASCCNNVVIYAPIVFVACLVLWSYFAYVVCFSILILPQDAVCLRATLLVFYHVLLLMFAWTYAACIVTPPATIPLEYWLTADEVAELAKGKAHKREMFERIVHERGLACEMRTIDGLVRHCEVCQMIKPDRTHHCSVCRRCVPKMDHHCPWVANCVGFHNYKQFNLLLLYTSILCAFQCFSSLPYVLQLFSAPPFVNNFAQYNLVVLFFLALIFFLTIFSLFLYHIYLIVSNRSTLEASRAPIFVESANQDRNATYNHGALSNMREVCGGRFCCWLLPISSSMGDGLTYTPRTIQFATSSTSTGTDTNSSSGIAAAQTSVNVADQLDMNDLAQSER